MHSLLQHVSGDTPPAAAHHRVAVWDLEGTDARGDDAMRVVAVVSQSDVLRCVVRSSRDARARGTSDVCPPPCACRSFLHRHVAELGDLPGMTLEALGLAAKRVHTVPASTRTLNAFAQLAAARLSAAGVTAADGGPLVANLSARCDAHDAL